MARDVMILMGANAFRGPLAGVALKIETYFGPEKATREASAIPRVPFGPKKSRDFQGPPLPIARVMDMHS
jgi:hypothetical protein